MQGETVRAVDDKVMPFLKSEDTGTEVFPLVNNFDGADWIDISNFLNNPERAHRVSEAGRGLPRERQIPWADGGLRDLPREASPVSWHC